MKRVFLIITMAFAIYASSAQVLHVFSNGSTEPDIIPTCLIQSISFEPRFAGSKEMVEVIKTKDRTYRYDASVLDSTKFNLPYLRFETDYIHIPSIHGVYEIPIYTNSPFSDLRVQGHINNHDLSINLFNQYPINACGWGENEENSALGYIVCTDGVLIDTLWIETHGDVFEMYNNFPYFTSSEVEFTAHFNKSLPIPRVTPFSYFDEDGVLYGDGNRKWFNVSYNEDSTAIKVNIPQNKGFKRDLHIGLYYPYYREVECIWTQLGENVKYSSEEHRQALIDLYNATDGPTWASEDWLSDKMLCEWSGGISAPWPANIVLSMNLSGLRGTLPESFEVFINDCDVIHVGRILYGVIPYNIRHHKRWQEFGWEIISSQYSWFGGGFNMADINLHIDNVEVIDFMNRKTSTTYEMLKKNKITWVFNAGLVDMIDGISDGRVNKYLDYCDKGLGVIATVGGDAREEYDELYNNYRKYVSGQYHRNGLPESIVWTKGFDKADFGSLGSMSLLDSEGNLLWYRDYDYGLDDSFYLNEVDSVCRKHLGEPSEHEVYASTCYRSVDYSRDGEVMTLQKASVGNGVDVIFMGDMYVDTLLVDGGQFEQDMRASMEYFFDIEPYKTLRDRFNVYAVKAVSPNGYEGTEHVFYYDYGMIFEYAQKVPNVDMEHVAITIIEYNPNFSFFAIGETAMWESGTSIAFIEEGGPSDIICHEMGGHGIAKLLDEYIYGGYEDNHTQEGANESFREWIKSAYHDHGWGMNVSASDDPEEVPWSHFLKDERYKSEVGIYQGAWYWPEELWRPSENSAMNNSHCLWFNAPSREAIYKAVMRISEGEDWTYDYNTFVAFDAPMRKAYHRTMEKPLSGNVNLDVQQRQVKLRPPKVYKGSWRDASKSACKFSLFERDFIEEKDKQMAVKPYIMYKGERVEADGVDVKSLKKRLK